MCADHCDDDVVACIEVLGATDDLQRLWLAVLVHVLHAHIDGREPHMVGIGVRHLRQHLAGHDVLEVGADLLHSLHLGAGVDVFLHEVLRILGDIDHVLQPLIGNAHRICLSVARD